MSGRTPTLEQLLQTAIDARLFDLHTAIPCVVDSFDKAKNTVTVVPALKRKYSDGTVVTLPIIANVPIMYPRGASWRITGPLIKGDSGVLIFSERSLDVWKKSGGTVDPSDTRKFHLTDALFYPGGYAPANPVSTVDSANLRVENGSTRFELLASGKMRLEKVGGDELLDLLIQLCTEVITMSDKLNKDTVNTAIGPQKLNGFSIYGSVKSAVTTIKAKVTAIKG